MDKAPGNTKACREAEIPVTEDWEARCAAKPTLRHALPDFTTTITRLLALPKDLQNRKFKPNLIHLLVTRGLSAVTPTTLNKH